MLTQKSVSQEKQAKVVGMGLHILVHTIAALFGILVRARKSHFGFLELPREIRGRPPSVFSLQTCSCLFLVCKN